MTLNTVTLTWDLADLIQSGISATITLVPTAVLTDTTDHVVIPEVTRSRVFTGGTGSLPGIIACDDSQITPAGWAYGITVTLANGTVLLSFSAFINYANGATQDLSSLNPVPSVVTMQAYMPLPTGTPTAGQVPVATGSGEASAWGSAGGAVSSVFGRTGAVAATSGDYAVGQVTGAAPLASPALTGTPTAPTASSLTDDTQYATTAYADLAVAVETSRAEALKLAIAQNLADLQSSATARTNLGLGTAATAALSSLLQAANNLSDLASAVTARTNLGLGTAALIGTPVSIGNGGTGQSTQQAAINALTGTQSAATYLRSNGTNASLSAIQAADLPAATTSAQGAVILDGTASDIQARGTQGAGNSSKASAANHVHPDNLWWLASDSGFLAWTFDPAVAAASSAAPGSGTIFLTRVNIRAPITCTNVIIYLATSGSGLTSSDPNP